MITPPLCQDCTHYKASPLDVALDECLHPSLKTPDHVRRYTFRRWYCTEERLIGTHCTREGKLFETRKPF